MTFSLDKEKALELAKAMDINVSFNNANPGVSISSYGNEDKNFDFEDFFPELQQRENFITKDTDVFLPKTLIKKSSRVLICIEQSNTISNPKKFTDAA